MSTLSLQGRQGPDPCLPCLYRYLMYLRPKVVITFLGHVRGPLDHQRGHVQEVDREDFRVIRDRGAGRHLGQDGRALLGEDGDEPQDLLPGLQPSSELPGAILDESPTLGPAPRGSSSHLG